MERDAKGLHQRADLDPYWMNYLAATVEHAAAMKHAKTPGWTRDVIPLEEFPESALLALWELLPDR